jgi:hypothetical protein
LKETRIIQKKQYAYGVQLNLGAKAWNDKKPSGLIEFF